MSSRSVSISSSPEARQPCGAEGGAHLLPVVFSHACGTILAFVVCQGIPILIGITHPIPDIFVIEMVNCGSSFGACLHFLVARLQSGFEDGHGALDLTTKIDGVADA